MREQDSGDNQDSAVKITHALSGYAPRIPIRWRWTLLVGVTVIATVIILFFIILDIERGAWLENQAAQAELQVERLADELKLPMLSGSRAETDVAVESFLDKVPTVMAVELRTASGGFKHYGEGRVLDRTVLGASRDVKRLPVHELWYSTGIYYAKTTLGVVAVRFSEKAWQHIAGKLVQKIMVAALAVLLVSAVGVYWLARSMSQPLEMLADAAGRVAGGDYQIRMPVKGNDEISDALSQFNVMVKELAHKQQLRDLFGRYLNPKLVSDMFEGGALNVENHRQEVSVLFADMVNFTSFSETTETEEVVSVLNTHFEVFNRIIAYYGGHVDKYIGDAVMAVFNHPFPDKDHVRHAAKAALAIGMACSRLGIVRNDGDPVAFRVGINCGQAIAGNIGAARRLEYTVIGDAVNVASRMGGVGSGGELVMSRETFDQMGAGFTFTSIGARKVKGVSRKLEMGIVSVDSKMVIRNLEHVVNIAFDLELPEDLHSMVAGA